MAEENRENLLLILSSAAAQADVQPMTGLPGVGVLAAAGSLLGLTKPKPLQGKGHSISLEDDTSSSPGAIAQQTPRTATFTADDQSTISQLQRRDSAEGYNANRGRNSTSGRSSNSSCTRERSRELEGSRGRGELERASSRSSSRGRERSMANMAPPDGGPQIGSRVLRDNSIVCFTTPEGELLRVVQNGKHWELQPCMEQDVAQAGEGGRMQYFNPQSLFTVRRRDRYVIFQSWGAEGRSLQAVGGNTPHRCMNHNLGTWESWEPTPQGLMNLKWPNKALGYDIHEISCVAIEDLRKIERGQLKTSKLVRSAEDRILESERQRKEVIRVNQRQANLHQREIDELRNRLDEAQQEKSRLEVELITATAAQKRYEAQLVKVNKDKDAMDNLNMDSQTTIDALTRELRSTQDHHMIEMRRVRQTCEGEVESVRRERDSDMKRTREFAERQQKQAHDEIQQREHQRSVRVQQLNSEHRSALKVKDAEIRQLVKECHRLKSIMKKVKDQMEDAQEARRVYEAAQAAPAGWNPYLRRGAQSFVPLHSGSSVVPNDPALFSSGGSQMDYPLRASPGTSLSGMHMDMVHGVPGRSFSPHYRNPRASPPASAMSGDWMDLSSSKTIVEEWMEKGQGDADGLYGKRNSSDESTSGVSRTSPAAMRSTPSRLSKVEPTLEECDESRRESGNSSSPELVKTKGAFGSATHDHEKGTTKDKWEAAQQLTVTTPSLDKGESNPPKSPEPADESEEKIFSSAEVAVMP